MSMGNAELHELLAKQPEGTFLIMTKASKRQIAMNTVVRLRGDVWVDFNDFEYTRAQVVNGLVLGLHNWSLS